MTLKDLLNNPKHTNWFKAAQGLRVVKQELLPFVDNEILDLQQSILNKIGAPAGCTQCTIENVIPCNTRGVCRVNRGRCNYHDPTDPQKTARPCPNNVCNQIYNEILAQHRYPTPCWSNTDASQWSVNHWQIAKCFMSPGYQDKRSAQDTDLTGLLSVCINCLHVSSKLNVPIIPDTDIFHVVSKSEHETAHTTVQTIN